VNLLANAFKFTRHRNPPSVEVGHHGELRTETIYFVREQWRGTSTMEICRPTCSACFNVCTARAGNSKAPVVGLSIVRRISTSRRAYLAEGHLNQGATITSACRKRAAKLSETICPSGATAVVMALDFESQGVFEHHGIPRAIPRGLGKVNGDPWRSLASSRATGARINRYPA